MAGTPKTSRLIRLAGSKVSLRLSEADKSFLKDLATLQLISSDLADQNHYAHLKGASGRSLERLEKAGLISSKRLHRKDGPRSKPGSLRTNPLRAPSAASCR